MYKYYKELEHPNEFGVSLLNLDYNRREDSVYDIKITDAFCIKYKDTLQRLKVVRNLIEATKETLIREQVERDNLLTDLYVDTIDFGNLKNANYGSACDYLENRIDITNLNKLKNLLYDYREFVGLLISFYPMYQNYLEETKNMILDLMYDIDTMSTIKLPDLEKNIIYTFPNAWYITPTGYLYNTNGKHGHKVGNLLDMYISLMHVEEDYNKSNSKYKSNIEERKEVYKRNYITGFEYDMYLNLRYTLPYCDKSYQKKLKNLYLGYLSAEDDFSLALDRIHKSNKYDKMIKKLLVLSNYTLSDTLVRYVGFNKIESTRDKTITTSNLTLSNFKEYLDRDWYIDVIPPIIYDEVLDDIVQLDLSSPLVSNYIDKQLEICKSQKVKILKV